jgi:hypothetical protein
MLAKTLTLLALTLVTVAVAVPTAGASGSKQLTKTQIARLGAQTEADGFIALTRYLVRRDVATPSLADLAARTEAKGYEAITRYKVATAEPQLVVATSRGFAWRDAFVGAAVAAALLLLATAGAIAIRRRTSRPLTAG